MSEKLFLINKVQLLCRCEISALQYPDGGLHKPASVYREAYGPSTITLRYAGHKSDTAHFISHGQ